MPAHLLGIYCPFDLSCRVLRLSPIIAFAVMYVGLFFPLAPLVDSSLEHYRFAAYTLPILLGSFLGNFIIRELLRRLRLVGQSAVEIERNEIEFSFNMLLIGGIVLYGLYQLITVFVERGMGDLRDLAWIECYLVCVAFVLTFISRKKYLTRKGISRFSGLIRWKDIYSYRWGEPDEGVYTLAFHQRLGAEIKVKIPVNRWQEIDSFITAGGFAELRLPYGRSLVEGG